MPRPTSRGARPASSPAKATATQVWTDPAMAVADPDGLVDDPGFLPTLDGAIAVPTIQLLSGNEANRQRKPRRRAASADPKVAASSQRDPLDRAEELLSLKEKVQFERQFMSQKLRGGSSTDEQQPAPRAQPQREYLSTESTKIQGKLTAMQRQNAKLKAQAERLEASKQSFADTQEHIDAAISGERLRRKNMESNMKHWEKERRDMLREARDRRAQIEALTQRVEASDGLLRDATEQGRAAEAELAATRAVVSQLQSDEQRRKTEVRALIKALAMAKEERNTAVRDRDGNGAELAELREELAAVRFSASAAEEAASATRERLEGELRTAQETMYEATAELLVIRKARQTAVEIGCQAGTSFVNVAAYATPRPTPSRVARQQPADSPDNLDSTPTDVEAWRESFEVFDTDSSGRLDAEKLRRAFADFGQVLRPEQLETMLHACGAESSTLSLEQFATIMNRPFQPELWRMARVIAEQRLAQAQKSGSSLLALNFIARSRQTAHAEDEGVPTKATPEEEEAAKRIQAVRRGLMTRQQLKQVKKAVGRMALTGASVDSARLVAEAFAGWGTMARRALGRRKDKKLRELKHGAAARIQAAVRGWCVRRVMLSLAPSADQVQQKEEQEQQELQQRLQRESAAVAIQARARGCAARRERVRRERRNTRTYFRTARSEEEHGAARRIQAAQRGRLARRKAGSLRQRQQRLASRASFSAAAATPASTVRRQRPKSAKRTKTLDPTTSAGFWPSKDDEAKAASTGGPRKFKTKTARALAAAEEAEKEDEKAQEQPAAPRKKDKKREKEKKKPKVEDEQPARAAAPSAAARAPPSPTKLPSFPSLGLSLSESRHGPPSEMTEAAAASPDAARPWEVAASHSTTEDDWAGVGAEAGVDAGWEGPQSKEEEEELLESFEVVCPACTMLAPITDAKCKGCGGSLADAPLAEL